jgi:hypothetical protein
MKNFCAFVLFTGVCAALFAESFDSIAREILSKDVHAALRGVNVAINTAPDAVSADFAVAFQNAVKKYATVVFMDRSITKKELQRQESGVVDDKEVARYGHEKGAEIVIQLILYRIRGNTKIKFIMTAVWVESNTLAASNVVIKSIPSSYNTSVLPLQSEDSVKKITDSIVSSKVKGIYNDPVKPPRKPLKLPKIELPKIDFSTLSENCWMGGNISTLWYFSKDYKYCGLAKFSFEYGRDCSSWNIKDRWTSEVSFLLGCATLNAESILTIGLDFNLGYQIASFNNINNYINTNSDYFNDSRIWCSFIVSAGISLLTENDISSFIPYLQLSGHIYIYQITIRFLPFTSNSNIGFQGGLCFKWML